MKFSLLFCFIIISGNITAWFIVYKNIQPSIQKNNSNQSSVVQVSDGINTQRANIQKQNPACITNTEIVSAYNQTSTHKHHTTENTEQLISRIHNNESLDSMLGELLRNEDTFVETLQNDPLLQDNLISAFLHSSNKDVSDYLISLFTQIDSPELQQLRLDLLQSGDRQQKIYGFKLLQEDAFNPEVIQVISTTLTHDIDDTEILLSAIYATPSTPMTGETAYQLLAPLAELTQHSDQTVREASLTAIGVQAKNITELNPILTVLDSINFEERVHAAHALKESTLATEELKNIVLHHIKNSSKHSELHSTLVSVLDRFSLTEQQRSIYNRLYE